MRKNNILLFASLITVLGVSSCKIDKDTFSFVEAYITQVDGFVTAEDSTPIQNIVVESNQETVFTDAEGYYKITVATNFSETDLKFSDSDGEQNGGQFCSEKLIVNPSLHGEKSKNNIVLQKMIKIRVGGRVFSDDHMPIKKIFVESEIDRILTDENGYYEIWTGAKPGENSYIYFHDYDYKQNGGMFRSGTLSLPLDKNNTFDNDIILEQVY